MSFLRLFRLKEKPSKLFVQLNASARKTDTAMFSKISEMNDPEFPE